MISCPTGRLQLAVCVIYFKVVEGEEGHDKYLMWQA